jgi:hypothetical protein
MGHQELMVSLHNMSHWSHLDKAWNGQASTDEVPWLQIAQVWVVIFGWMFPNF